MAGNQANPMTVTEDVEAEEADETEERTEISKDDLFHVLQNERRRRVLTYLVQNGSGPFEMRTIAEHVAAEEHGTTVQALTSDQRQRVYIALYQSHLPKLDEKGFIDYQQSRGVVEKRDLVEETKEHLSTDDEDESPPADESTPGAPPRETVTRTDQRWEKSFMSAVGVGILLVSATWTGAVGVLSGPATAAIVVAMFAVLTAGMVLRSD